MRWNTKIGMFACRTTSLWTWPIRDRTCECPIYITPRMKKKERKRKHPRAGSTDLSNELFFACRTDPSDDKGHSTNCCRGQTGWKLALSQRRPVRQASCTTILHKRWLAETIELSDDRYLNSIHVCLEHGFTLTQCLEFVASRDRWAEWPKPKLQCLEFWG